MRKALAVLGLGVFALAGFLAISASTSTPNVAEIPDYSMETSEPDVTDAPEDSEITSSPEELNSKYRYFLKNDKIVVEALLEQLCTTDGVVWVDFNVKDTGDYIFVVSDAEVIENGQLRHPVISYIKAKSSKEPFKLLAGGSSEESWTSNWGCPVDGSFDKYNTQVSMTTQQLINEGY